MERAKTICATLFAEQGAEVLMDVGRIAFICKDMSEPMLAVCLPFDGGDCRTGNDAMVAFPASSKDEVKALYDKAISLGVTDEGEPGQRIPVRFYGAYSHAISRSTHQCDA